jgi:hypothetical protein
LAASPTFHGVLATFRMDARATIACGSLSLSACSKRAASTAGFSAQLFTASTATEAACCCSMPFDA